ncbi:hypothetical protein E1218_05475 [Kribbella turkmenica]|uniref:Uncharacterized protein n=1 Tax=Kribbella turkmenica TaxID=2530375 RepID=A0A4R4XEB3_9ACTN|nr:hypothetical protein [Kribbella turkmenica]TDD29020.1 hypothetical protein E1218_05475 [Kribbella turkmenica]
MPAESRAPSVVAALSVVVAVVGHVLAGGGPVPLDVIAPLLALTSVCWLLGEYLAGERLLTALVLAGVQLFVHVTLAASHTGHEGMHTEGNSSLLMPAAHLAVLFAGVLAIGRAHRWIHRVARTFARLLPRLPTLTPVLRSVTVPTVPSPPRLLRWLTANVSRRGPPVSGAISVPS